MTRMKPETVLSMVQSLIYAHRARTNPPRDPSQLHITGEQYDVVKQWATDRPLQSAVSFGTDGEMYYNGVKLLISSRRIRQ